MLVLNRKRGEELVLPDCGVTVTVLGITGKRVRLGIAAPPEVSIQRHEIRDRGRNAKTALRDVKAATTAARDTDNDR